MSNIAIITDTNSSLPKDISQKYGIYQVPIHIQFSDKSYVTGQNIDDVSLFKLIDDRKVLPTTAAPSPEAFRIAFYNAFNAGADEIICICCSSEVSATHDAAMMAKEMFEGSNIMIVDSRQLSLAEGYQVILAAELAAKGLEMEEIIAAIEKLKSKIHVFAALPTLKYLAMGGRMGKLAAGFGNTLEIKPILTSKDGKLDLLEKVRTWRKARERLLELAVSSVADSVVERIGLIHVNNEKGAISLYESLAERLTLPETPIVAEFTPGLSVHTGSGVIGFVLITK